MNCFRNVKDMKTVSIFLPFADIAALQCSPLCANMTTDVFSLFYLFASIIEANKIKLFVVIILFCCFIRYPLCIAVIVRVFKSS